MSKGYKFMTAGEYMDLPSDEDDIDEELPISDSEA